MSKKLINRIEENRLKREQNVLTDTNKKHLDFSKIKVGVKNLDDAILTYGDFKRANP